MTDIVSCDAMKVDMRLLCKQLGSYTRVRILAMNQMEVVFENGNLLQSYDTVVAARVNGKLYFSLAHDYSRTTSNGHRYKETKENDRFWRGVCD